MEQLILTKVKAFAMEASDDERSSSIKGYYKNKNIASIDAKDAGWYGSNGKVIPIDLYEDLEGNVYLLESIGKYKDDDRKYREEAILNIKLKLTPEEQLLLGI